MTPTDGHVDVKGTRVRYSEMGSGDTVVILDPGTGMISALREALSRRYRAVSLELGGFGDLAEDIRPKSARETANLVASALGGLTIGKYGLIAYSAAASVALWQALRASDDVDTLILISPVALLPTGNPLSAPREQLVAHSENAGGLTQLASEEAVRMSALTGGGVHDAELESRLAEVSCATLAVFGQNDLMVAPEAPRIYREKIPNCNISFVYDAGHAILADRPEALINAVSDFIERRETFIVGRESGLINP